jgi:hypothetical protein
MTSAHEIAALLSASAAFVATALGFVKFWQDRSERRIMKHQEQTMANTMRGILRGLAAQTMRQIAGVPAEQIYSLDVRLRSGECLRVPLLEKTWVQYLPSLSLMLIRSNKIETEFLMDVTDPSFLPWHSHTGTEEVTIIRGSMIDLSTGHRYAIGETWQIPAEQWHRAQFEAGTLCRVVLRPPLETAAVNPIDLSHMHQAFDYEADPLTKK